MSMFVDTLKKRLKKEKDRFFVWFLKREKRIVFIVACLILSVLSFEIGVLFERGRGHEALVVEKPVESIAQARENRITPTSTQDRTMVAGAETEKNAKNGKISTNKQASCLFVGSKNSRKYHSPSCSYAKRIKPENQICFASKEEAEKRGYVAGCIQ